MKNITLLFFYLFSLACNDALGQGAIDVVTKHVNYTLDPKSSQAASVLKEASVIIGGDRSLQLRIEAETSRGPVHDALMWGAAKRVKFDQNAFASSFPALYEYGHILLVSTQFFHAPRVIYQLSGASGPQPRMIYGSGNIPVLGEFVNISKWHDPDGLSDWIGNYDLKNTDDGPYLVSTTIGRETTGATSIRHILYWVRIEATRLVPERFEAYDVPLGQERQASHLTSTALPEAPAKEALPDAPKDSQRGADSTAQSNRTAAQTPVPLAQNLPRQEAGRSPLSDDNLWLTSQQGLKTWPWLIGIFVLVVSVLVLPRLWQFVFKRHM